MEASRIIKKFKELTVAEEREYAVAMNNGEGAVTIIVQYLEESIVRIDSELTNLKELYSKPEGHLYVATLLARRAAQIDMHTLLTSKVVVQLDDQSEE